MMAAIDSPGYPESPLDEGDAVFPCKGCGEILEEGKAFELAGNRWHIDCFRCNTCGTLLDSDANLLLLGDGSLICNNCTYSCNACGNKIEDLAILTGDQAFCAACFRCRNCKRKIENLRYARTSQGIFCMSCHESLMARRRKKAKSTKQATTGAGTGTAPVVLDKSLPALPPNAVSQSVIEGDSETSSERAPRSLQPSHDILTENIRRDVSPLPDDESRDNLTLPASTYNSRRKSSISSVDEIDDDSRGFLPMAFDPSPAPSLPPQSKRRTERTGEAVSGSGQMKDSSGRDYFTTRAPSKSSHRDALREGISRSRDITPDGDSTPGVNKASSPHIAMQEKGWQPSRRRDLSGASTPVTNSATVSPSAATSQEKTAERPRPQQSNTSSFSLGTSDNFRLQEAPRARKNSVRANKTPELQQTSDMGLTTPLQPRDLNTSKGLDTPDSGINPFDDPKLREGPKLPARGDSLTSDYNRKPVAGGHSRNGSEAATPTMPSRSAHGRTGSSVSISSSFVDASSFPSRNNGKPPESPARQPALDIPPRAAARSAPSKSVANADFISPRAPPPPPSAGHDRRNESVTSLDSNEDMTSPMRGHFKKPSLGGDFNMEDEMARIMAGQRKDSQTGEHSPSVLRRVSNAVRHGRSFSDRSVPMHGKTSSMGHIEISSPLNPSHPGSPTVRDEMYSLKAHLRRAQQRIAELESEKVGMEHKINHSTDIKQYNTELREKRSTMAFLDTQREMVVRELEVMTEHLTKAKESNQPLDFASLKSDILQDFAHSLQRLKGSIGSQIEDLVARRNQLTDEIANLIQVKDKGLQEFESLSTKNHQLNDLNNQLVNNIQDIYKSNRVPNGNAHMLNGLGIYTGNKSAEPSLADLRSGSISQSSQLDSPATLVETPEVEHAQLLNAPQVVNIRKGQPKRFNWKKGGRDVAKNVTKGLKGAFARDEGGMPISGPYQTMTGNENGSMNRSQGSSDRGGLGLFPAHKNSNLRPGQLGASLKNSSSQNLAPSAADPSTLFGSELIARCDYEKRVLPAVLTRCVEEVEARGMDVEGVYRKSGGSGLVKQIQMGFEKDSNFDISDPDLDIHAVTSCLKQYLRRLPDPLITYDMYDSILEASSMPDGEMKGINLKVAVANLPERHRDVLEYLIHHLARIVEREAHNLMTPLNISVVFAPTIMRPLSIEREMTDMQAQREVVRALLDHRAMVFD